MIGESEGLEVVDALGGVLHWLITPFQTGGRPPTYGRTSALVHFVPAPGTKMHKYAAERRRPPPATLAVEQSRETQLTGKHEMRRTNTRSARVRAVATLTAAAICLFTADARPGRDPGQNGKVAFTSGRDPNYEVYSMNADGSSPVNLSVEPRGGHVPSFAPSGTPDRLHQLPRRRERRRSTS